MKYALVGNNDGPLRLLKSIKAENKPLPFFVGLQKEPEPHLLANYQSETGDFIPFFTDFNENRLIELLHPHQPEILINCFCNFKFTELLEIYTCYNIHPSFLPRYRGRHPLHWALINGEKSHGITLHEMSKNYDDGPIIWQEEVALNEDMSVAELREELMKKLKTDFPQVLSRILTKTTEKRPNSAENSTYIKRRSPEDSRLSEWHDAGIIYRKIKALRSEGNPAFLPLESVGKLAIIDVKWEEKPVFSEEKTLPSLLKTDKNALLIKTADKQLIWLFSAKNSLNNPKIDFAI